MNLKITNFTLFTLIAGMTTAQASLLQLNDEIITEYNSSQSVATTIDFQSTAVNSSEDSSISYLSIITAQVENTIDNGKLMSYHENGSVKSIENYKRGKLHGEKISYFTNGTVEFVENYKKGLLVGDRLEYFENGQLNIKSFYKKGKLVGFWHSYSINGAVESYGYYEDGNKVIIFSVLDTE
jgi:hypothetical protein